MHFINMHFYLSKFYLLTTKSVLQCCFLSTVMYVLSPLVRNSICSLDRLQAFGQPDQLQFINAEVPLREGVPRVDVKLIKSDSAHGACNKTNERI